MIELLTALTLTVQVQLWTPKEGYSMATCTAVYISPTEALTAGHCVEDSTGHVWVKNHKKQSFTAHIKKVDVINDLCLLSMESPKSPYAKLGEPADKGDKIFIMSSEMDMPYTYGEGIVANIIRDIDTDTLQLVHTAVILSGASGSGLFNEHGELVGINIAKMGAISFAVDETIVKNFLKHK